MRIHIFAVCRVRQPATHVRGLTKQWRRPFSRHVRSIAMCAVLACIPLTPAARAFMIIGEHRPRVVIIIALRHERCPDSHSLKSQTQTDCGASDIHVGSHLSVSVTVGACLFGQVMLAEARNLCTRPRDPSHQRSRTGGNQSCPPHGRAATHADDIAEKSYN